jgi:hypothetical protein
MTCGEDAMARKPPTARVLSVCSLGPLLVALAACSEMGFGSREPKTVDPNVYPEKYKTDLVAYVRSNPGDMLNVRDASLSAPALRQFGQENRYFACLRTGGPDGRKDKLVVFFSGRINQFVDATAEQCGAAAYQPFPELVEMLGQFGKKK